MWFGVVCNPLRATREIMLMKCGGRVRPRSHVNCVVRGRSRIAQHTYTHCSQTWKAERYLWVVCACSFSLLLFLSFSIRRVVLCTVCYVCCCCCCCYAFPLCPRSLRSRSVSFPKNPGDHISYDDDDTRHAMLYTHEFRRVRIRMQHKVYAT